MAKGHKGFGGWFSWFAPDLELDLVCALKRQSLN